MRGAIVVLIGIVFCFGIAIVFVIMYHCLTTQYYQCVNDACVRAHQSQQLNDVYKNDPTCNSECRQSVVSMS